MRNTLMISNMTKEFVEENIEIIESQDYLSLFKQAGEDLPNYAIRELYDILYKADLDIKEAQDELFYDFLQEICNIATLTNESLHSILDHNMDTWYGWTSTEISQGLLNLEYNLNVRLKPAPPIKYKGQNYKIYSRF